MGIDRSIGERRARVTALSRQLHELGELRIRGEIARLCEFAGVTVAAVMGRSRSWVVSETRERAWAKAVTLGIPVSTVARIWRAEEALVISALRRHRFAPSTNEQACMDPSAWLHKHGVLGGAQEICDRHQVTLAEVFGRDRHRRIVDARHAIWTWLRGLGWSYPEIARPWGVHHTAVLRAVDGAVARREVA